MKKKQLEIKTNVRFSELKIYKRRFMEEEISETPFLLSLNDISFPAILKYGLVPQRLKYDRRYKFKIYFDGIANKAREKKVILDLKDLPPSKPILMTEMLYAKDKEETIMLDNGDIEYHFTFLQY